MRSLLVLVLLAGTAHAEPPKAATRGLMIALGDGDVRLASLIDPARGVWFVRGNDRKLVCGKELIDLVVESEFRAGTWGRTATCQNRGDRAGCILSSDPRPVPDPTQPPAPAWQLQFERGGGSLVLRAVAPSAEPIGDLPHGQPCPPGSTLPAEPLPVIAPVRRDAPEGGNLPTVATMAMLRHLAKGDWHLADFVDHERGLMILDNPPDGTTDGSVPKRNARVCGTTLPAELAAIQARIAPVIGMIDKADGTAECANGRGWSVCRVSVIGEWGDVMHLYFRQTPHGLVLDVFTDNDEHQVSEANVENDRLSEAMAMAHAWLEPCP